MARRRRDRELSVRESDRMNSRADRAAPGRRHGGDREDRLIDLIFDASFLSLATSDPDGVPWCSPLEYVCDADLRLYWVSKIDTRHSENVRSNPRAAIAIYDSGQTPGAGMVDGLYADGTVDELDPTETARLMSSIQRWIAWRDVDRAEPRPARASGEDSDWRFYRLTATAWYSLEAVANPASGPSDVRVAVDLAERFNQRYRSRS